MFCRPTCSTRSVMCPAWSHCTAPWWHRSSSYDSAVTPVARLCRTVHRTWQDSAQGSTWQDRTAQGRGGGRERQNSSRAKHKGCLETGGTQAGHCQQGHTGVCGEGVACAAPCVSCTPQLQHSTAHSRVAHQSVCDGAAVLYDLFDGRPVACVDECCRGCDVCREVVLRGPILVDDLWWWGW